jgi:hypothetical protein
MDVKSSLNIEEDIELRDNEFSRSQSSIHTLDLIDNSQQSSSLSMMAKNPQMLAMQQKSGQSVNKSGSNPPSKGSNKVTPPLGQHTFLSEEEFHDYYEYSEDDDEEIFPFIDPSQQ